MRLGRFAFIVRGDVAAGMVLAATAPGHLGKVKTTVLLSAEAGMEAMRKAGEATYRAPGQ